MPIFDNELSNVFSEDANPSPYLGSPAPYKSNIQLDTAEEPTSEGLQYLGATMDQMRDVTPSRKPSTFNSPFEVATAQELYENRRYPVYQRGLDLENLYGEQQHWYSQLGNSIVKMGATAGGTFAQTFGTIPNLISAIHNGKISDFSAPDGYESSIDSWLRNLEDKFPNFYTKYERDHPFLSALKPSGMSNFWGDKVIKNLGFTIGAIGGAVVQDAVIGALTGGIGETPLLASQIGKASLFLGKIFARTNDVEKVLNTARSAGVAGQGLLDVAKLAQIAKGGQLLDKTATGVRYALGLYSSSAAEAGIESRDGFRLVKEELVKQYKIDHFGEAPSDQDLVEINKYAEDAMNVRFGINMALLTVSHAIQFGGALKVFNKSSDRAIVSSITRTIGESGKIRLKEGSIDVFEEKVAKTIGGKTWASIKPILPMMFIEGVYEEGGQYAAERGTYDYYTRKYKNPGKKENIDNWNTLNETINSTIYGFKQQFGTDPGLENMLVGALTAVIIGKAMKVIDNARGIGQNAQVKQAINTLNQYGITGTLSQKYDDTLNSVGIAKEMEEATTTDDVFKYKNLNRDMFFNMVMSRIPSERHGVTIEQLNMLKELKQEDFEKTFGMSFEQSNKHTVESYVDELINKANTIKQTVESLDNTFKNPFKRITNPVTPEDDLNNRHYKTFNEWKTNLAYYASVTPNLNTRLTSINESLIKIHPLLNVELVSKIGDTESLKELSKEYEQKAVQLESTINEFTTNKRVVKSQVKSLHTVSEKINLMLNDKLPNLKTINSILNFELNNQDASKLDVIPLERTAELYTYGVDINRNKDLKKRAADIFDHLSSEEGIEKYFEQEDQIASQPSSEIIPVEPSTHEFKNKAGKKETVEVGREYESSITNVAKVRKIAKDRWRVTSPTGEITFPSTKEKAQETVDDLNSDISSLARVKVLELNPDGTIKIEDLSGNIVNISPTKIEGYVRLQTEQEKLSKDKKAIDKEQTDITNNSGETNTPTDNTIEEESLLKPYYKFFISTINQRDENTELSTHTKTANEFINNAKNIKDSEGNSRRGNFRAILINGKNQEYFGLSGLAQLSYGFSPNTDINTITDILNEETGFLAQVYVEQIGNDVYFIDKDGNHIGKMGETIDVNKVVFQTMPTTSLFYDYTDNKGRPVPRYRKEEKDEFITQAKAYTIKRQEIFNTPEETIKLYKFSISRGIPLLNFEASAVGDILIDEDLITTQQGLIQISVEGNISHQGENINVSKGSPVLQYGDTVQILDNNKFGTKKVQAIYQVIKAGAKDIQDKSNSGKKITFDTNYVSFLQNVLYWRKDKSTKPNQIYINTDNMTIELGGKSFPITEIAENEEAIVDILSNAHHNINRKSLEADKFNKEFIEYTYEGDVLIPIKWINYQSYLLLAKSPDGSRRNAKEIPLSTFVIKPTERVPYSFKQKYTTLSEFELPVKSVKKLNTKNSVLPTVPMIGKYKIDTTENIYPSKFGDVIFTAEFKDGVINVTVKSQSVVDVLIKNDNFLKQNKLEGKTIEESKQSVLNFMSKKIALELEKLRKTEKKESTPEIKSKQQEIDAINNAKVGDILSVKGINKKVTAISNTGNLLIFDNNNQHPVKKNILIQEIEDKYFDEIRPPDEENPYRRVGEDEYGQRISETEIRLFKDWAKETVPNISYEVAENILMTYDNKLAWGAYENSIIKFYKHAIRGTEYHEAFEGIWKDFSTSEEKQLILDEFKQRKGEFVDRQIKQKIFYADATDLQAKERIADDFAEYRLGKLPARNLGERILRFFKNIIEFFKSFGRNPSLKDELFKAIDTGRFKEKVVPIQTKIETPEYSRISGLSETKTNEFVEDMVIRASQFIFGENKEVLYDPPKVTGKQIYDRIKEIYNGKENKYQALGEEKFNELFKLVKEHLYTLGININEEDNIDINESSVTNRNYAPEPFSTDWKRSSGFQIKFTVATLTETLPTNQQEIVSLPKSKLSAEAKGYLMVNFSRVFATLLSKFANTTNIKAIEEKLLDLARTDSNYVRLFTRLGGELSTNTIPFHNFNSTDWRLFINFYQTFTKQRPDAFIQYVSNNEVYTTPADQFSLSKQIQRGWFENMKLLSKEKDSIIKLVPSTKTYQVKKLGDTFPVRRPKEMIDFLTAIGIDFSLDNYLKLKGKDINYFNKVVSRIRTYLEKAKDIGTINGKTLGINAPLSTLSNLLIKTTNPNQENTRFNLAGTKSQIYTENNYPSIFENDINNNNTIEEIIVARPELNDVFSTNNVTFKKGGLFIDQNGNRIKDFKISYIEGTDNIDNNKGVATDELSIGDTLSQGINQNLNGNYYILIPAESATEWMANLGNPISMEDIQGGKSWNQIYTIFKGYLKDDISLALENNDKLRNIGTRAKDLRIFKEILNEKNLKAIDTLIEQEATQEEIEKYINEHVNEINSSVKEFIIDKVKKTKDLMISTQQVTLNKNNTFNYKSIDNNFINEERINKLDRLKLSEEELTDILTFVSANYIINNIEFHKILFGDPYQFAIKNGNLEETKRIKSFLSPRRTTFDSPLYNTFLNQEYNRAGVIPLSPNDPGYHLHKSYANTVTFSDINLASDLYTKINEANASSVLMIDTYREIKLKNGQWGTDAESWYQWQMAYTRQNISGYKYTSPVLETYDKTLLASSEPLFVLDVLKPIVSGVQNSENKIKLDLDKCSQMPIYFKAVQGKAFETMYTKLWNEKVDYVIFESGRKVGIEKTHNIYNEDGIVNNSPFALNTQVQIPWKIFGIQLENSYSGHKDQTRGVQITKLSTMDMFDDGKAISPEVEQLHQQYTDNLNKMHENAFNSLLETLGVENMGIGFKLTDPSIISKTLKKEMLKRKLSSNTKDTIQLDENGEFRIPFEASPAYKQIKDILYSMINKSLVSVKVNGISAVQVPVTLWENAKEGRGLIIKTDKGYKKITREEFYKLSDEDKKKVRLSSDTLKFYTKESPYCEVMLPCWFRDKLKSDKYPTDESILKYLNTTEEGQSILSGIGFRIPTQGMSSVEVFKVKGFLPAAMGDTIVVPSEITAKAGSDFDIDKLNTYLKSIYIDNSRDIRLVKYQGSEQATKEFFDNVFSHNIMTEVETIENKDDFREELLNVLLKLETVPKISINSVKNILEKEDYAFYTRHINTIYNIIDQAEEQDIKGSDYILQQLETSGERKSELFIKLLSDSLRKSYVDRMYKKSLENQHFEILEKLLTLPNNFEHLVTPVDAIDLLEEANELEVLRNAPLESSIKNRLLDRTFMVLLRNVYVKTKSWVGIAAVNITGHSTAQKIQQYVDTRKFNKLDYNSEKVLGDGTMLLPHNTTLIEGVPYISMSGVKTIDGKEYISDRLSKYATGIVDAVNNPYIINILYSNLVVGTAMFLERVGGGKNVPLFINQPIIREYLNSLDNINYKYLYKKDNIDKILKFFPSTIKDIKEATISIDDLASNISNYYENGKFRIVRDNKSNVIQQKILKEFLKYSKMAEYSFKFTQATNYDTNKFNNSDAFSRKQTKTEMAQDTNIISSVEDLLNSNFMAKQVELLDMAMSSMGAIFRLEEDQFRVITSEVMKGFEEREYMSKDDFDIVASKVKASFLDYVIQINSGINLQIKQIMNDATTQLLEAQKNYPDIKILKDLSIESSDREEGAKTIKLTVNLKEAYDEDLYVGMMRELKQTLPELYNSLIKIGVLQGSYQSSVSIKNILPIEDYAKIVKPVIDKLYSTPEISLFSKGMFQRNNWENNIIFPNFVPRFVNSLIDRYADPQLLGEDQYGNEMYKYYTEMFPSTEQFGNDKRVLILNPLYNPIHAQNDFLKIKRVIPKDEGQIDFTTGKTVSSAAFAIRKKNGDLSLNDIWGYQKVKYLDGSPLITKKGEYVYKLINLWGDGQLVSEYYTEFKPSVLNNGTMKIDKEILDEELINYFAPDKTENIIPMDKSFVEQSVVDKSLSWTEIKNLPIYSDKGVNVMRKQNTKNESEIEEAKKEWEELEHQKELDELKNKSEEERQRGEYTEEQEGEFFQNKTSIINSEASPKTLTMLKDFIKRIGVDISVVNQISSNGVIQNANGVAMLMQKLIQVVEGKEATTLPEEAMHFVVAIIKQTSPKLYKQLMSEINNYQLLNDVFRDYSSLYQTKEEKPDVIKLKEEAIAKILTETVIKQAENITEKPELLTKVNSWWESIIDYLKKLFVKSGFDRVAMDIISGKEIGMSADIKENETFLQKNVQANIIDRIDNIASQIKLKDESYYINDEKIPRRVSDVVKSWYQRTFDNKDLLKNEFDKSIDDLKKDKGTLGHKAFDYAFHLIVDENGYIRKDELDDTDYEIKNPGFSKTMYEKLKENLKERLLSFPENTRFRSEITVYSAKRGIAGTIDLLAVEANGKMNILDWKFMDLNTEKYDDIPWYKVIAWRTQMDQYKYILEEAYNIKPEDFNQTRMIPILTVYSKPDYEKNILPKLLKVKIGAVNPKDITDDYLLPLGTETEKTGNKQVDELLIKLNTLYTKLSDKKVVPSEKQSKAKQLNKLFSAIRQLQMKSSLTDLLDQSKILNKQLLKIIDAYNNKYLGKDPTQFMDDISQEEINKFSKEITEGLDAIEIYVKLDIDLKSLFNENSDKKLKKDLRKTSEHARDLQLELKEIYNNFVAEMVVKTEKIDNFLSPEKVVKDLLSRWLSSSSTLQIKGVQAIFKKANRSLAYTAMDTLAENRILDRIKTSYENWANSKGILKKNYFDLIKKKDKNELIDEFQPEFYSMLKTKTQAKDYKWIRDNIDVTEYTKFLKEKLQEELTRIDDKSYTFFTQKDMDREIAKAKSLYNISTDKSPGWLLENFVLKFPKQSWQSDQWKELTAKGNESAKEFYDYIRQKNKEYKELGYIHRGEDRTFLPYIRKGLIETLVAGGNIRLGEQFFRNISVDEGDVGYGKIDRLSGQPIDELPKYFTSEFEGEFSTDLFRTISSYNEAAIRYKYLSQIEDQVRAIVNVERNKKAIATSMFGKTQKKEGVLQYSVNNNVNSQLVEDTMKAVIYGQRYITSETFDQLLMKLGTWGEKLNKKLGVNIFPEGLSKRQLSVNKSISQLNSIMQMNTLGFNLLSATSNLFGGNMNSIINAGVYYTKSDYIAAQSIIFANKFNSLNQKKMLGALEYFLPLTDDYNRYVNKNLSLNTVTAAGLQDSLFYLMRQSDWNVQIANFYAYLNNTIVENGEVKNVREYLRTLPKYQDKYVGTVEQRKAIEEEYEKEVKELINQKGILKIAQIVNNEFIIPGVNQKSRSVVELRRKVQQLSKNALGNLTQDDIRMINLNIYGKSFMVFKNWIPRLVDVRMGNMKYNAGSDAYEWGRTRMVFRIISEGMLQSVGRLYDALSANEKGVDYMRTLFEKKSIDYLNDTGKTLEMTEDQFIDLVRQNIKGTLVDAIFLLSLYGLILAIKAVPPDDDEYPAVKSQYRFALKMVDKFRDELMYFYDPTSFQSLISKGVFPTMTLITNFTTGVKNFLKENWALAMDDEATVKNTHVIKYWLKNFPVTNQLQGYLPMFYPELAKELDVKIQSNYGIR